MTEITNWNQLINSVEAQNEPIFNKLLVKINQFIRPHIKSKKNKFDLTSVSKNHLEIFNGFVLMYEQLLIEKDITDIYVEMPSLTSPINIALSMIGIGKWIKFHNGNSERIFFFDEEKTIISDKSLADFLNKISDIKLGYKYFGKEPVIYCKFRVLPSPDIIKHLANFGVIAIDFKTLTDSIDHPKNNENKVLIDQAIILTLCSNLSFGLSDSFYSSRDNENSQTIKEVVLKNKDDLDTYLSDKIIMVNKYVYDQTDFKINMMGGQLEKKRFEELCNKLVVVPDETNPRFYYLKDTELLSVSVAERERCILATSNQRLGHKLDMYYSEIHYKLFGSAQLVENRYV